MELQITKQQNPVLEFNKDEIKKWAREEVKKYKDLVFTKDTKKDGKKAVAELRKLKKEMNDTAIKIDKAMSADIKKFRDDVKEIAEIVEDAIAPIDKQIKEFDEAEKQKKRDIINGLIAMIVTEYQLDEKHAAQLTITDKYLNASEKIPKITTDLKNRAEVLKIAQMTVAKNLELIISTCDLHKETIALDVDSYLMLLDSGREVFEVVNMINNKAQAELTRKQEEERQRQQAEFEAQQKAQREAFEAEQRAREEAMRAEYEAKQAELQKQAQEPQPEPAVHSEPIPTNGDIYTNILQISGTSQQMYKLHDFLTSNEFKFKKIK